MAVLSVGNVSPSLYSNEGASSKILDLVFRDNALLLQNLEIFWGASYKYSIPMPLLGFIFDTPSRIEFLRYRYAEYPFLNKSVVANASCKETTNITIKATRPIYSGNGIVTNYGLNTVLRAGIETYCDKGGLFTLNTMWGLITDLALESLSGEPTENNVGGVVWIFELKRLLFSSSKVSSVSDRVSSLAQGGI